LIGGGKALGGAGSKAKKEERAVNHSWESDDEDHLNEDNFEL
jgi:hypothetical protein